MTPSIIYRKCCFVSGEVLSEINTNNVNNSYAAVSPCGRFVAASGKSASYDK